MKDSRARLASAFARIDQQVQAEGLFMKGVHDDWFWMDNCHLRRRTATLGELAPRAAPCDDDGAVFFMDW